MTTLEKQLWLWLEWCEDQKPRVSLEALEARRPGGTVLAPVGREEDVRH